MAPSDEGAVERSRETGGEKALPQVLSLRLLLRKIHLPHQREAFDLREKKKHLLSQVLFRGGERGI